MHFPFLKIQLQSPTPSSEWPKCCHPHLSDIGRACFFGRFSWSWDAVLKVTSCSTRFICKLFPARTESRGGETWEQSLRRIWEEMMSVRFGSGAEGGVLCVFVFLGGRGIGLCLSEKRDLAICLQRGGVWLLLICIVVLQQQHPAYTVCTVVAMLASQTGCNPPFNLRAGSSTEWDVLMSPKRGSGL